MERKVLLGVFLLILPFGSFGAGLHELVKRGANEDHNWGYEDNNGPKTWPGMFDQCGGKRQSPINIPAKVDLNDDFTDFEFDNFEDDFEDVTIVNNGHTIQVTPGKNEAARTFTGAGGLDDTYQFLQLHFHWGSRDNQGSEHRIQDKSYPLEMHLVCMNKNYATIEEAKAHEDGLAVLGVLFKIDDEDNEDLEPIIEKLSEVKKEKSQAKVDKFNLKSLLPDYTMPYYRYDGSLTTPPCLESVQWIIFKNFAEISRNQLEQFRQTTEDDKGEPAEPLQDNYRPPQPLNGRVVEISGKSNSASSVVPSVLTAVFTALALLL